MREFLISLSFLVWGHMFACAQSNYVEGYIITKTKDTVRGWIDFRTDRMNAKICRFKSDLSVNEQQFYPTDIYGFRYIESGKLYISKTIEINNVSQMVFLEYLIQGIMNLYYYKDDSLNIIGYYIFENEKGEMQILTKRVDEFDRVKNSKINTYTNVLKKDYKYKNVLNYMFGNVEKVSTKISNAEFKHEAMIDITKEYHNQVCTTGEECIEFETRIDKKKIKLNFGIYAGYEWISKKNHYRNVKCDAFVVGGRIGLSIPRWNKSISTLLDLSYTRNIGNIEDYNLYFDYPLISKFKLDYGFKYTYYKGIIRPTVETGISMSLEFYPSPVGFNGELFGGFVGAGIDFKVMKDSYIFILLNYSNTNIFRSIKDILRFKIGYKF
jgi:hypothetical protein